MMWQVCSMLVVVAALLMVQEGCCQQDPCPYGCYCQSSYSTCFPHAQLSAIPNFSPSTQRMYILGSNLSEISDDTFMNYTDLRELVLQGNSIKSLSGSAFANNPKLITLNLANNDISELNPQTFSNLPLLQTLILSGNNLRSLSGEMFSGMKQLRTLKVGGNQLVCDCKIAWMKTYGPLFSSESSVICSTPPSLEGQDITTLSYEELGCVAPSVQPLTDMLQGYGGDRHLELHCEVTGVPVPEVQWYREGMVLVSSMEYILPDNGSLLIVYMTAELGGEYLCSASNVVGTASATVQLQYAGLRPPVISTEPSDTHAFVGNNFSLLCVTDHLTETYQWLKDGYPLSPGPNLVIQPRQELQVLNAQKNDSGVYMCVAGNSVGVSNVSVTVEVTSTIITCDGTFSASMFEDLREKVDIAFNRTQEELKRSSTSPSSLLRRLRFPESGILEHLKAAEIFDQAISMLRRQLLNSTSAPNGTDIPDLSECELEVLSVLSGCEEHREVADCSDCFHRSYRSPDGSCNNLDNPTQGATGVPFLRLLDPAYEDGVGLPVGWGGRPKPSARSISRQLISTKEVTGDDTFTLMLMQFGQFLDHDLDLAPGSPSDIVFDISDPTMLSSCDDICHNDAPCFPIPVSNSDPRISRTCLPFARSSAVCGTGASSLLLGHRSVHREQINVITSYIDGSMVYGSTEHIAMKLREPGESGKLLDGTTTASGSTFLPFDNESLIECSTGIHANRSKCFLGGDVRTNEQVGLTSMHTLFYREHNRVVAALTSLNPHWDGETLYQEARKIVGAEWQHIVYNQYLPKILGSNFLGEYSGYGPSVDASIANAFATAAYRFGHSQIMPLFPRLDQNYQPLDIGPLRLQDAFFAPFRIVDEGGIDPLVRGLISSPVKMRLSHQPLNNNLTEALFAQAHEIALDLASLNIQRGRDHGLPSYAKWRTYCGLGTPTTIEDLSAHISNSTVRAILQEVYGDDPDNIDLWVGGLLEDTLPGTQLGPTFRCIIGDQFRRLRDGDRFYYERTGQFSPDQLVQIKQASLSRIICDNADNINRVPADAFILEDSSNYVSCGQLPRVDLFMWKDCGECTADSTPRTKRSTLFKSHTEDHTVMEDEPPSCKFNGVHLDSGRSLELTECITCSCLKGDITCTKKADCQN